MSAPCQRGAEKETEKETETETETETEREKERDGERRRRFVTTPQLILHLSPRATEALLGDPDHVSAPVRATDRQTDTHTHTHRERERVSE